MCHVGHRRQECGVHQRRPEAEQHRGAEPGCEVGADHEQPECHRLHPHPASDHPLAPPSVAERAGGQLRGSPDCRVRGGDQRDAVERQTTRSEQDRQQPPHSAVVEVVRECGLAGGEQRPVPPAREQEDLPERSGGRGAPGPPAFELRELRRVADREGGESEADQRERDPRVKGRGPQPVGGREIPGGERGERHGDVPRELVQAHRETAALGAHEVDLHDDRCRPAEPLVDAEQHVRKNHPCPARRPDEQERDGNAGEPAGDQDALATHPIREPAGGEVGGGLHRAEADEERKRGRPGRETELRLRQQRQHRAL